MESRSAATPTPGSPARYHHEYGANATVTLPRTGSQTEIRDPLKVLRALVSGVFKRQTEGGLHLKQCGKCCPFNTIDRAGRWAN